MANTDMLYTRGCRVFKGKTGETQWQSCTGCQQMASCDSLCGAHNSALPNDVVEVRFKHTHKGFFKTNNISLSVGDVVAVESDAGHDIGMVSLTGDLVYSQMLRNGLSPSTYEYRKVYRKAKSYDIEKWSDAVAQEKPLMIRARQIVASLRLNMKIGDVEMYGSRTKAIFYYIADERVDFRELIKLLNAEFNIRIEMKQIGARQEAGRTGSIGTCGREVCCSSFLTKFATVTANHAYDQNYSTNPAKLSGQCGKVKCCLRFEHSAYMDAQKDFPKIADVLTLDTNDGTAHHIKTDIFRRRMWYYYKENPEHYIAVPVERVIEILEINKRGEKAPFLVEVKRQQMPSSRRLSTVNNGPREVHKHDYKNAVGDDNIARFDKKISNSDKKGRRPRKRLPRPVGNAASTRPQSTSPVRA
jgi:cell fate regulator YaaT (PSP1 superfamily)